MYLCRSMYVGSTVTCCSSAYGSDPFYAACLLAFLLLPLGLPTTTLNNAPTFALDSPLHNGNTAEYFVSIYRHTSPVPHYLAHPIRLPPPPPPPRPSQPQPPQCMLTRFAGEILILTDDELIYTPGRWKYKNGKAGPRITRIYVSTKESVFNGESGTEFIPTVTTIR
jgi:hypothetical protein